MIKRMNDFLAGLPMTVVGGVFLIMSFVFPRIGFILPMCVSACHTNRYYGSYRSGNKTWCDYQIRRRTRKNGKGKYYSFR